MRAFDNSYMHATFNILYRLEYADGEHKCWLINFPGGGTVDGVRHITDAFRVARTMHIDITLLDKETCITLPVPVYNSLPVTLRCF